MDHAHVKLLACDLLSLTVRPTNPPAFTRNGRLVAQAETVGVVVSRERKGNFLKFLVDDGSGCVPCVLWLNHHSFSSCGGPIDAEVRTRLAIEQSEMVQLGRLVRVRGAISFYRGAVEIKVGGVVVERDPNMEVLHWLDCIRLARRCYDQQPSLNRFSSS